MVSEKLNENNFLVYAMHHYDNPQCHSILEFEEDMKRFLYLKKLLSRYKNNGELRERLILNHIIVLYNIFGESATRMLFYKIDSSCWDTLVTFLVYLERMPDELPEFGIVTSSIMLDENIINTLRTI
ncbi:hypothetical protein UFOVP240_112 [uncultured Caudovirales phage]|uniref:Uncharacterized protein n=1 Tax=uncultured Caudovirales phage TaxID=2100421 RepID=A0A6J7X1R5_9CAUD|nr:hypothetical protein UFOVP240_112 [uncultured Caudovirales phage]